MDTPLMSPPNTATSRGSSVMGKEGTKSVKILVSTMTKQDQRVNRLPTYFRQKRAGRALMAMLMGPKGSSTPANSQAHRMIRRVSPVNPPGNRSPAWTKLLRLIATISAEMVEMISRAITDSARSRFFP